MNAIRIEGHDLHLLAGADYDSPRDLTDAEEAEVNDSAAESFFGDDGKALAFATLRIGSYVMSEVILSGWDDFEARNKKRQDWPELAEQARALIRLCNRAQREFAAEYEAKQRELADDARCYREECEAEARES